ALPIHREAEAWHDGGFLSVVSVATLATAQGEAAPLQNHGDVLGRVGEQMQLDARVDRSRAVQYRADQTRLEGREQRHELGRKAAQVGETMRVGVGLENSLAFRQARLDLSVARQRTGLADSKALGRFALRLGVTLY